MSAKFSAKVGNSRRKFMLVYLAQPHLLESVRDEHLKNQARIRAERYRMAAIRDANLQIKLWSALTEDQSFEDQESKSVVTFSTRHRVSSHL